MMAVTKGILTPALFAAGLLLTGCDRVNRVNEALELTGTVSGITPRPIGPDRLRVSLPGTGAVAALAPIAQNSDVTVWQTLDGITLSFRRGVLVATRGLGDDLMSADVEGDVNLLHATGGDGYYPHIRSHLDGENRTVFRSYQCRRTGQAPTRVKVSDQVTAARRIEVLCVSRGDEFTNIFWLDGAGRVIKSRQWVSTAVQYMETERIPR
jgi:hypothetical protein